MFHGEIKCVIRVNVIRILYFAIVKNSIVFLFLFSVSSVYADIQYIKTSGIKELKPFSQQVEWVKNHRHQLDHWAPGNFPKSERLDAIARVLFLYRLIPTTVTNIEALLFKSEMASYLFNLNELNYNDSAIIGFKTGIHKQPNDYRSYWFLGKQYAQSNEVVLAIAYFKKALRLTIKNAPESFWNDLAETSYAAGMPAHAWYAMNQSKRIWKHSCLFDLQFGDAVRRLNQASNFDTVYQASDVWFVENIGRNARYVSKRLGIAFAADTLWKTVVYDYKNQQNLIRFQLPAVSTGTNTAVTPTFTLMIHRAAQNEKMSDFIAHFIRKYPTIKKSKGFLSDKNAWVYDIQDPSMYPDLGGGHLTMIAFERSMPANPGMSLELPHYSNQIASYFRSEKPGSRISGTIYYVLLLDAAEAIYSESNTMFRRFVAEQFQLD